MPAPFAEALSMRRKAQRWKLPLGIGAGNGDADCCGCAAGCAGWGAAASGGGAVVRRRTIFFGFGGGGAAAVEPSSSAAASPSDVAAGAGAGAVESCLLPPLDFPALDFGSSPACEAAAAAAAASCCCRCSTLLLYKSFGTPCSSPGTPSGNTGLRSPGSFFLVSRKSNRSVGSQLLMPLLQPPSAAHSAIRTAEAVKRGGRRMAVSRSALGGRRQQRLQRL